MTLVAQQRACDEWVTTFNHVRPHEALGQRLPSEVYRVSTRRPRQLVVGGFPDTCRIVKATNHGAIRHDGRHVYVSTALADQPIGLQVCEPEIRVWYYNVLLGSFMPGQTTVEPIAEPIAAANAA